MNIKEPLVSICCITYNHENYIRDAIEGFIAQKTTFSFEIIIHDDASTDGTVKIIKEYARKFPDLIIPIYQSENQCAKGNKVWLDYIYPRTRGKYIALCEGDDYWIDPLKLQKQVEFLEMNPDYGLVHTHYAKYIQGENKFYRKTFSWYSNIRDGYVLDEIIQNDFIKTLTVCYRKNLIEDDFSKMITDLRNARAFTGDRLLWIYLASKTKIKYFSQEMAIYRVLNSSASHFTNYYDEYNFYNSIKILEEYCVQKFDVSNTTVENIKYKWDWYNLRHCFIIIDKKNIKYYINNMINNNKYIVKTAIISIIILNDKIWAWVVSIFMKRKYLFKKL
ncbi:MAG: glycosyltransferase [Candidatus Cloacimonetes bacterium]|nr:glycosyltransferase [Candidatus Cloacimonadota bacterium]